MNATRKYLAIATLSALTAPAAIAQTTPAQPPRVLPKPDAKALAPETAKQAASRMLTEARRAWAVGDRVGAEKLVAQAGRLGVPEKDFGPREDSPARLALMMQEARYRMDPAVITAAAQMPANAANDAVQALHVPENDGTTIQPAAALTGPNVSPYTPARLAQAPTPAIGKSAAVLLAEGEQLLRERDLPGALQRFEAARASAGTLDPGAQNRLADHLRMLNSAVDAPARAIDGSMIDSATEDQQVLARQLAADVGRARVDARELWGSSPREALELLETTRRKVESSGVAAEYRDQFVRLIDRSINDTKQYIEQNRAQIELDERNAAILADIDREQTAKLRLQQEIQTGLEKFNDLMDEHRIAEAEVQMKRLYELAPDDPMVKQALLWSKFARRNMINDEIRNQRDEDNWNALADVDRSSSSPVGDRREMVFDYKSWKDAEGRSPLGSAGSGASPVEQEIRRKLETLVPVKFTDRPLAAVIDTLGQLAGINIHLDQRTLSELNVSSDTPVTINLDNGDVTLRSALNLILEDLDLAYTIKDDVLKITSREYRDNDVEYRTYYVADLVIPIPNFVPSSNVGMQGLINDALAVTTAGAGGLGSPGPISLVSGPSAVPGVPTNPNVLAQNLSPGGGLGAGNVLNTGPAGQGGAAAADFDSLIDLITSTVESETWAENGGGEAEIRPFPTNLSLVISQTQEVHEKIADLLEQLRRLQDLQVTIEVRFIRLNDSFFERIGIDFDMNINDNILGTDEILQTDANFGALAASTQETVNTADGISRISRGATVGIEAPAFGNLATVTADLDLPFRQGSFPLATPQFGDFSPDSAATFGFAILSDIEAYFLISAAQGDSRTNVLNAPKVTLFNGQQAFVADQSQRPFVLSVVPVVGEFAAAQQPVIVVLSEGTFTSVQAVVSEDRRYVRMTVTPFFTEIGDVETFTFDGSTTTTTASSASSTDANDDGTNESASGTSNQQQTIAGTTVQQPTFQQISVSTTVSVPDGGTVLLGGIKRLSEGRREFGVPLLSKVPYISRLFRNVGIGRDTESLMLMVTPRIIIQEEEEVRQGLAGS